ncbi:hypothetical protein CFC21_019334 [Triticum aestivum]|uniref:Factor of DNA methylation 1-5/IDN2 domain-containing protein n=3 Tax=Triticum TaxID=4564 RepID=A0A9R1P5S5_TRITD|nr:hypothetical protein CFC21_019334 [Triticum aestivum]VAH37386.1 unnamed protein product [Triticum turgidum subsp. durum]
MSKRHRTAASDPWDDDQDMPPQKAPPGIHRAKFGMVHKVDWSRLIWDLAEKEMVDLSKGRRPDWTCHYAAYLQRLIWVDNPGLFQPALPLLGLGGDQNLPSELQSKMQEVEARSKLLDARSKLLDTRAEHLESKSKELEERALASKTLTELELLNRNLLAEKEAINSELEIKGNGDLKNLREELAELRDGMQGLESLNQVLVTKNLIDNDKLQAARKELIDGLMVATNGRANIGLKRMGELDPKAVANACRPRLSQKKTLILCSKWEAEIRNAGWHPFKVIMVDDQPMEIFLDDDDKLVELKQEYGDQMFALVKQALIERNKYNPSGGYPETLLWNFKHSREATMEEAVQFIVKKCCANKRKR